MHNLNLYKYYDKSLAEVNKEYLYALKNKPVHKTQKSSKRIYALVASIVLAAGLIVINYTGIFEEKQVETVSAPPPPDLRTEEEKQGYVQIQIFEFADTPVETITEEAAKDDSLENEKTVTAENKDKKETALSEVKNTKETAKKEAAKPSAANTVKTAEAGKNTVKKSAAPLINKQYTILFENIDERQQNRIKDLSEKYGIKLKIVDAYSSTYSVWKVYERNSNGNTIIAGEKVTHVEDFLTREDATEFAAKRNLNAIVQQVGVTEKTYNTELCCTDLETAKNIAKNSRILDRIIKVIRVE